MTHVNPLHPNIYQDKLAASQGAELRNGRNAPGPGGKLLFLPTAKRHLIPRKDYRHCVDAQVVEHTRPIIEEGKSNA